MTVVPSGYRPEIRRGVLRPPQPGAVAVNQSRDRGCHGAGCRDVLGNHQRGDLPGTVAEMTGSLSLLAPRRSGWRSRRRWWAMRRSTAHRSSTVPTDPRTASAANSRSHRALGPGCETRYPAPEGSTNPASAWLKSATWSPSSPAGAAQDSSGRSAGSLRLRSLGGGMMAKRDADREPCAVIALQFQASCVCGDKLAGDGQPQPHARGKAAVSPARRFWARANWSRSATRPRSARSRSR